MVLCHYCAITYLVCSYVYIDGTNVRTWVAANYYYVISIRKKKSIKNFDLVVHECIEYQKYLYTKYPSLSIEV